MRILLYVNSYLPKIGGRELVVHTLATQLQKLGHSVHVVGPGGVLKYRHEKFDYPLHRWFQVPFIGAEKSFMLHLIKTRLIHRFDVVHSHTTYPTGYMAAKMERFLNVPLVITPHGNDINIDTEINHGLRLDPVLERKIRFALSQADAITAISNQVKESLESAGVTPERVTSIPNGVDLERFQQPQDVDVHAQFGLPADAKVIVTIGNYHKRKGHELLIEAVRRAREKDNRLALIIVGATSRELVEKAERDGLLDWLVFAGSVRLPEPGGPDLLAALLQAAGTYVSSSISNTSEGMSLALLEAMAAGTCVVATKISGSADLLANGKYGELVPANDCEAMCASLLKVLSNSELQSKLEHAGFERVGDFSWESITKKYLGGLRGRNWALYKLNRLPISFRKQAQERGVYKVELKPPVTENFA